MKRPTPSLGVRAATTDGGINPILDLIAREGARKWIECVHAIRDRSIVFSGVPSALGTGALLADAIANLGAGVKPIDCPKTFAPCRCAAARDATHGCAPVPASAAVDAIHREISAGPATGRTLDARQRDIYLSNRLMASLVDESRPQREFEITFLETNRIHFVKLRPRKREGIQPILAVGNKRSVVVRGIIAQQIAADDVAHPIWIGQQSSEDKRFALCNFAYICFEAEEYWCTIGTGRTSGRLARRARCRLFSRLRLATPRLRRGVTCGWQRRWRARGSIRVVTAGRDQNQRTHCSAHVLHERHHATAMTGAQQIA